MHSSRAFSSLSWGVGALIVALAIVAWANNLGWQFNQLNVYLVFPVLGLLAFSLMWSHYTLGAAREYVTAPKESTRTYWNVTSFFVLLLIILHPGLYWLQLYLDGFGLPPASYLMQFPAGSAQVGAVMLGSVSLVAFLLYELHRWFKQKSWWQYIEYFNIVAMFFIFYHGLTLGGELMGGWYRIVWFFYGITLIVAISYTHRRHFIDQEEA